MSPCISSCFMGLAVHGYPLNCDCILALLTHAEYWGPMVVIFILQLLWLSVLHVPTPCASERRVMGARGLMRRSVTFKESYHKVVMYKNVIFQTLVYPRFLGGLRMLK